MDRAPVAAGVDAIVPAYALEGQTLRENLANCVQILNGADTTALGAKYLDASATDRLRKLLGRALEQVTVTTVERS